MKFVIVGRSTGMPGSSICDMHSSGLQPGLKHVLRIHGPGDSAAVLAVGRCFFLLHLTTAKCPGRNALNHINKNQKSIGLTMPRLDTCSLSKIQACLIIFLIYASINYLISPLRLAVNSGAPTLQTLTSGSNHIPATSWSAFLLLVGCSTYLDLRKSHMFFSHVTSTACDNLHYTSI